MWVVEKAASHNPYFSGNLFAIPTPLLHNTTTTVTILILVETSLQCTTLDQLLVQHPVTILILVETSLQFNYIADHVKFNGSHNPYFSGNLFAMSEKRFTTPIDSSHNPYFSGNLFAIYSWK